MPAPMRTRALLRLPSRSAATMNRSLARVSSPRPTRLCRCAAGTGRAAASHGDPVGKGERSVGPGVLGGDVVEVDVRRRAAGRCRRRGRGCGRRRAGRPARGASCRRRRRTRSARSAGSSSALPRRTSRSSRMRGDHARERRSSARRGDTIRARRGCSGSASIARPGRGRSAVARRARRGVAAARAPAAAPAAAADR